MEESSWATVTVASSNQDQLTLLSRLQIYEGGMDEVEDVHYGGVQLADCCNTSQPTVLLLPAKKPSSANTIKSIILTYLIFE